jgi:hypothetical protein
MDKACTSFWGFAVAVTAFGGCRDSSEKSIRFANDHVASLVEITEKDVAELERGLPDAAIKGSGSLVVAGTVDRDPATLRTEMSALVRAVPDLKASKSTFFAVLDEKGVGIRNNLEIDTMAGRNFFTIFPGLQSPQPSAFVTAVGQFPELQPGKKDRTWIAASALRQNGATLGFVASGWSWRAFAHHLQDELGTLLRAAALKDESKLPVFYVGIFDPTGVYVDRLTPEVNERALEGLHLDRKTEKDEAVSGVITIEERTFGFSARLIPKLAPKTGIVVIRSEI